MYKVGEYHPNDSMSKLICDNYPMLLVMSRFGIDLGVGEGTIGEVCLKSNVDIYTFLSVVNILTAEQKSGVKVDYNKISLRSLMEYLHNSHSYFLEYRLPTIRQELVEALESSVDVSVVVLNYYDEYVAEVNKHMMYEENTLFPYINSMLSESAAFDKYSIDTYCKHHDKVEAKLSELKNILIKYCPVKTTYALNNVLYDIFSCERDLASHNCIEDYLLVPAMKEFESIKNKG
ncbi:MAG: hemerythrin domain-containing protein [Rikenellaceae bacterium]